MNREALADRVITYSDALVAFSLVNGLAFLVALADPDARCSIAGISGYILVVNVFFPIAATLGLVALGRVERRLRKGTEVDEEVARFWRGVAIARFVLVWAFAAVVLFGVVGATQDPTCDATALAGGVDSSGSRR